MSGPAIETKRSAVLVTACVCLALGACNPTPGEGLFEADALQLSGCEEEILPWLPGFFTIDQFENKITIRIQSIGGGIELIDGIFIQVDEPFVSAYLDEVRRCSLPDVQDCSLEIDDQKGVPLGDPELRRALNNDESLGLSLPARMENEPEGGAARGVIGFYESCPEATVIPELVGRLRFTSFEPFNGGQITGFVTAPVVVDTRSKAIIGQNLTGRFSFNVQKGRPYTNFTGPGNQSP